jgi:UDP-N-acetylmuramoyl-tripeptide--D-alanyl-D-alanine ligase
VVTSIGEEHLAQFGDLEGVAAEEFSFIPFMRGRAFVAVSDQAAAFAFRNRRDGVGNNLRGCAMLTFGFDDSADLRAGDLRCDGKGQRFRVNDRFDYRLPLLGRHNTLNALAAIAIGTRFRLSHVEIADALARARGTAMRLQRLSIGPFTVINDAYNANPDSMRAAIDAMDDLPHLGRRVLILGDMRELGTQTDRCHRQIGEKAGRSTAQVIISVGAHARVLADGVTMTAGTTKRIYLYPSVETLTEKLPGMLQSGDIVLLKASRGVRLERVIPAIEKSVQKVMN